MKKISIALLACTVAISISSAANVVSEWNAIASTTIVKNGGKPPGAANVWFAYSSLAVYDAVNAITGTYRPYYYQTPGPRDASVDAAAVAAAHRILVNYFPGQKNDLDAGYNAWIAAIGGDASARDSGIAVGEAAALAVIAARSGDGLEANITYTPGSGPGVWVPTPPAFAAAAVPWLGQMRPFTMSSPAQYLPDAPTSLNSEPWKRDYVLTQMYGGATSTLRSAAETEIGIFWTEHPSQQNTRAFNNLVDYYSLDTAATARLMAIVWTGAADASIACWNAKYTYGFWRPVTAIQAGGGNPALTGDASWTPLGVTPAHPEYPAAHGCVTGANAALVAGFFGTTKVHVVADSLAFTDGSGTHQHVFEDTRDWIDEVFWARIYGGFHFHHSLEVGKALGESVAREVLRDHFRLRFEPSDQAARH